MKILFYFKKNNNKKKTHKLFLNTKFGNLPKKKVLPKKIKIAKIKKIKIAANKI